MNWQTGRSVLAFAALSLLVACSGSVQQKLGLERRVPDEFQVVRRAPLTLPPDFTLRPPYHLELVRNAPFEAEFLLDGAAAGSQQRQRAECEKRTPRFPLHHVLSPVLPDWARPSAKLSQISAEAPQTTATSARLKAGQ